MDRNSIIGFVLIAAILFGYTWYSTPTAEEAARMQRQQDSLAAVELEQRAEQAAAELPKPAPVVTIPVDTLLAGADSLNVDSLRQALAADKYGVFHPSSTGSVEEIVLENERMQIGISTKGVKAAAKGRTISKSPANPTALASQCRSVIGLPSTSADSPTMKKGAV